jgi:hypothetical protein
MRELSEGKRVLLVPMTLPSKKLKKSYGQNQKLRDYADPNNFGAAIGVIWSAKWQGGIDILLDRCQISANLN